MSRPGDARQMVHQIPDAIRAGADPNLPFGPLGPTAADALIDPDLLDTILELGADPNMRSGRGYPILLEALLRDARGSQYGDLSVVVLKEHGARWDVESRVPVPGGEMDLPIPLAFVHLNRSRAPEYLFRMGVWLYGAEGVDLSAPPPGLDSNARRLEWLYGAEVDPTAPPDPSTIDRWGGNLAHHHIWAGPPHPDNADIAQLSVLKRIRIDMHAKADLGDPDEVAWAKLSGTAPPFLGLTPVEFGRIYWSGVPLRGRWEDL